MGSARNYDFLNLTTQKDLSQSSIAEETIEIPKEIIIKPKAIQTIQIRKTVRELKRERILKEIEANKKVLLMDKDDYGAA